MLILSKTRKGVSYMVKCEAAQFLCEFKDFIKTLNQKEELLITIDQTLQNIVEVQTQFQSNQK